MLAELVVGQQQADSVLGLHVAQSLLSTLAILLNSLSLLVPNVLTPAIVWFCESEID